MSINISGGISIAFNIMNGKGVVVHLSERYSGREGPLFWSELVLLPYNVKTITK